VETIFERVGALDVHKAQLTACVRVPAPAGRRAPQLAEFQTTVQGLLALRDWLAAYRVTHVAMEATGVYWQPVWHMLEDDFELTPCNARHVKNVPGRKTDVPDAQWLCQLMGPGCCAAASCRPSRSLAPLLTGDTRQAFRDQLDLCRIRTCHPSPCALLCAALD